MKNGGERKYTSSIPKFGLKRRVKKSNSDSGGANPVIATPLPGHILISSIVGVKSTTSLLDNNSTYVQKSSNVDNNNNG